MDSPRQVNHERREQSEEGCRKVAHASVCWPTMSGQKGRMRSTRSSYDDRTLGIASTPSGMGSEAKQSLYVGDLEFGISL